MKLVINKCYGGFGLSNKAIQRYLEKKGKDAYFYNQTKHGFEDGINEYTKVGPEEDRYLTYVVTKDLGETTDSVDVDEYFADYDIPREDPDLVETVEELGDEANGDFADLQIVNVPDGVDYYIDEYDGVETVNERHRSWG